MPDKCQGGVAPVNGSAAPMNPAPGNAASKSPVKNRGGRPPGRRGRPPKTPTLPRSSMKDVPTSSQREFQTVAGERQKSETTAACVGKVDMDVSVKKSGVSESEVVSLAMKQAQTPAASVSAVSSESAIESIDSDQGPLDDKPNSTRSSRLSGRKGKQSVNAATTAVDGVVQDIEPNLATVEEPLARKRGRKRALDKEPYPTDTMLAYNTPDRSSESDSVDLCGYTADMNDEERERAKRVWRSSVMQLWNQIAENKNANLFRHPVDKTGKERYSELVHQPMDLNTIKRKIETGVILSLRDMEHDLMLMFTNAIMYNPYGDFVYNAALEMRADTLQALENFRDIMASSIGDDSRENRRKKSDAITGTKPPKRGRKLSSAE